ncbi:MAG: cobalt-precorrin-5B (C(1))-methyltransferase CbiD, partial [Desulfobacteraceae bacterium]
MTQDKNNTLKSGFTTGAASAAAAKAALQMLLDDAPPDAVEITFLSGGTRTIPVHRCRRETADTAVCTIIKDAGDDPDITHGAEIGARVTRHSVGPAVEVMITGGAGVGRVTKPGLEIPPGEPAINTGPRKMIRHEIRDCLASRSQSGSVRVEVFVPLGEALAKKTLNARLGILGGISILGTTGIERPMSHDAYVATIDSSLSVAAAAGCRRVVLATGRRSERFAQIRWPELPAESFIQIGDFFERSLRLAVQHGVGEVMLAVFFGKAIKMAQGVGHTHAAKSSLSLPVLADWTQEATGDPAIAQKIRQANTARQAFGFIHKACPQVLTHVGKRVLASARRFAGQSMGPGCVIFDYAGSAVFEQE